MGDFVIGQPVAIYQGHYTGGFVTRATVERETKHYWIANGRKFRKSDHIEPRPRNSWDRPTHLLELDDPRVVEAIEKFKLASAWARVMDSFHSLELGREKLERITALKQALDDYATALK